MKRLGIVVFFFYLAFIIQAQQSFPKNMMEDKEKIMSEAYWNLWNPKVQAQIDKDIDANRKADAVLKLNDVQTGSEINVEQVSHDFIFGAHIFNYNQLGSIDRNTKYKELYGTIFNSATIAYYWKKFEMQPNRPRFYEEYWDTEAYWNNVKDPKNEPHWRRPSADQIVEFCKSKGIRLHGHTIIWGNRHWQHPEWLVDEFATPEEQKELRKLIEFASEKKGTIYDNLSDKYKKLTPAQLSSKFPNYTAEMKRLFAKRITELANYYKDKLDSWDVVNESATDYSRGLMISGDDICKSTYGLMPGDYTYEAFKIANKVFPSNVLMNINDYKNDISYTNQVKDLLARGCKIDIMGSQMHLFQPQQCLDIAAGKEIETPKQVWDKMSTLGQAGLPIHLSEITITSPGDDEKGRKIQAVIAQNLYRLWFSIKPMMGITWWNVVDDCGAPGEPSISGLFTRNMDPKPSFYALDNLINHEWKTSLKKKVTKTGEVKFRGFKGKYRISWVNNSGETQTKEFYLKKDGDCLIE